MEYTKLGPVEGRFADLIWENAPVSTAARSPSLLEGGKRVRC